MFEKYEEPAFTLVKSTPPFEWRDYKPFVVAEVMVGGPRDDAANAGFRKLAGYIFGGNKPKESMAMTIPVMQQKTGEQWKVQFVMPLSRSLDTLPATDDADVRLYEQPAKKMLAIVFSGTSSEDNLKHHLAQLRDYAAKEKVTISGEPLYAFYNSPFSLPFMRRNEIMFALE